MAPRVLGSQLLSSPHYPKFFLCGFFIFLSFNTLPLSSAQISNRTEDDRKALLRFKDGISDDPKGVLASWHNDSLNFCSWQGVNCGTTLPIRVVSMDLRSLQLRGTICSCLGTLASLVHMDLSSNYLSGNIPDEIGALPGLQTLMLGSNNLQGNIPPSLGVAESLNYVDLSRNNLSGVIPDSLGRSSSLSVLILSRNSLSGEIPGSLFKNSSKLVKVDLQLNILSGVIPYFQNMAYLDFLGLTGNMLYGSIPASLGNISTLSSILLALNNLIGPIPKTLGQIPKLNILDLSYNGLLGNVPAMLYNVSSLKSFNVSYNMLTGKIPSDIGHTLPNLELLIIRGNKFHGGIPVSLATMLKLQAIDLSSNFLNGSVPSLGSLSNLNLLILGSNMLQSEDWSFLTSLTNCSQLLWFSIEWNVLNGRLPKSVGNLSTKLERLQFGGNKISGTIPAEIGNLVNLTLLEMDQNKLSGTIPFSIGNLKNLFVLRLSNNRLSGEIPTTIGESPQLNKLYLDENMLSGNIPVSLEKCTRLTMLNLSVNNLSGSIPREILGISSLSLGLDLSNNKLTGTIPPQIGYLINLVLLKVSNNMLSGEIPPTLGLCAVLESLQMESNMLSGTIPESFENFKTLNHLDISYNYLEGPIPSAGIFKNSNAVALQGNKALCQRIAIFALPICPNASVTKRKINAHLLMIMVPPAIIALLSFLCVVANLLKGNSTKSTESFKETMKKVSYGDILKATNWFSPVNRISSSHTASVYIGRFEFDTDLVAIKVFHLDEQGSINSFFAECDVLKHTRHRNLIQAITSCSTVDFENNEFKALVYEFMANGSLDMWIHPRLNQGIPRRVLSLGQRISIAANVASALDYLHNQLTPPLIHCDLKPSNVLLDYDMTSCIGDFGSALFLSSSLSDSPKCLVGARGTIGYIAPEYGMGCKISTSGDVYSFGMLLLEMLTAKRPTDTLFVNGLSLHKYVASAFPDKINCILDPQMPREDEDVHKLCMQKYIIPLVQIGLMCSMESPKDRTGMRDVCTKIMDIQEAFVEAF